MLRKKIIGLLLLATGWTACTQNFDEINTDPNRLEKIDPSTLMTPTLYDLANFNYNRAHSFTHHLMQFMVTTSTTGGVHRYADLQNAGNSTWNTYYLQLTNIKEMYELAVGAESKNYQAVALTLRAWVYANLTDCFGDVPMTEACRGDEGILTPKFDTQQKVYEQVLSDLETANSLFDESESLSSTDLLYDGDVRKWRKFANSLHMRSLLRLSKRSEMNSLAKLAEMIGNPVKYPVFENNADGALLPISGISPYDSPISRLEDFRSNKAMASFFVNTLVELNDPRLTIFMDEATKNDGSQEKIGYKGYPSGFAATERFDYNASNINATLGTAPMKVLFMTYAEVEFIKAEMAWRGLITDQAAPHYRKAVEAIIEQWGGVVPGDYFDNPKATYDGTLERILLQKHLAAFFCDYQAWFEYRRTGLPEMKPGAGMDNNKMVPVRFNYPATLQQTNKTNYEAAVKSLGGPDDINTKVWWEK